MFRTRDLQREYLITCFRQCSSSSIACARLNVVLTPSVLTETNMAPVRNASSSCVHISRAYASFLDRSAFCAIFTPAILSSYDEGLFLQ